MAKINWNAEGVVEQLTSLAGDIGTEVSVARLAEISEEMGGTPRSVGAKLRKIGYTVQKAADAARPSWTQEEADALAQFVTENSGAYTYAEIAPLVLGGKYTNKQIQGKVLSLELTAHVKPAEKVVPQKTYTDEEEATIISMAKDGKFMEEIADALGKSLKSVRGKTLSMSRSIEGFQIPAQRDHAETARVDVLEGLDVANLTAAEIAEKTEKTERGIKQMLTRRGLDCADHKGSAKRAKLDSAE